MISVGAFYFKAQIIAVSPAWLTCPMLALKRMSDLTIGKGHLKRVAIINAVSPWLFAWLTSAFSLRSRSTTSKSAWNLHASINAVLPPSFFALTLAPAWISESTTQNGGLYRTHHMSDVAYCLSFWLMSSPKLRIVMTTDSSIFWVWRKYSIRRLARSAPFWLLMLKLVEKNVLMKC